MNQDKKPLIELPSLGDVNETHTIVLTQPEINTLNAILGFYQGMSNKPLPPFVQGWINYYVPVLKQLVDKINTIVGEETI